MLYLVLSACCGDIVDPTLHIPPGLEVETNEEIHIALEDIIIDTREEIPDLQFNISLEREEVDYTITDSELILTPQEDWSGTSLVTVEVIDRCDARANIEFTVQFGSAQNNPSSCTTNFSYSAPQGTTSVLIAGSFNDWTPQEMNSSSDGLYTIDLDLSAGTYPYKFIVQQQQGGIAQDNWICDPQGDLFQCDAGQDLNDSCPIGANLCNSVVEVHSCAQPSLHMDNLNIADDVTFTTSYRGSNTAEELIIELDGEAYSTQAWNGATPINISVSDVPAGRHRITATVKDNTGQLSEPLYIPFWADDFDWNQAVLYFVFVDRFFNGDTSNDNPYGANWATGDYMGGDWQGVINKLDYLQDLGVDALWLTAPIDNPDGVYAGQCSMTITGYHGYWPASTGLEEHFGTEDKLQELIQEAHNRGMRVLVDWVGNHLHNTHPYVSQHPEWFTQSHMCDENDNWNNAPETCWFAPYIPTINYYQLEPIQKFVDEAIELALRYDIDGYRVDAVKHIPRAVHYNMQSRIKSKIEHSKAGGSFEFYTVGETFSADSGLLSSYVSDSMLDGQFDFALYWSILSAFARNESGLPDVEATFDASKAAYGTALMSNFLGNHDVERFISHAAGEVSSLYGDGLCPNGYWRGPAEHPYNEAFTKLKLAWTWLLTHEGPALIYYGDEIGLAGYHDPDNRQFMIFDSETSNVQQDLLSHVQVLTQLRKSHPEIIRGEKKIWWEEADLLAVSRASDEGYSLVVINRGWDARSIQNSLSWAGLPTDGSYTDHLSERSFSPNGDSLSIDVPAQGSMVLTWSP